MKTSTVNTDILNGLSEEEKKLALKILQEYAETGQSELFEDLKYADFEEIPVDITTFMHDRTYLGTALTDPDGNFTVFPYWEKCLQDIFPDNVSTKYNNIVFTGAIGLGKAQPLDTPVLAKDGFIPMKDIKLGQQVFGPDGNLHTVIGVFPQGVKKVCKVMFTDNTSTLCCDEHLWTVYNTKNQTWTTVETKQLIDGSRSLKHAKGHRYKIPITAPINFEKKSHIIDPYVLGVLLGDGHITHNITFSSADQEIVNNVKNNIDSDYEVRKLIAELTYSICKIKNSCNFSPEKQIPIPIPNKYFEAIKQFGLNTTTINKYIPEEYLLSTVEDRIALLQGLMDTDGHITKDGSLIEFTTISPKLKDNFVFLVQSLGGICHVRTKKASYKNSVGEKIYCNQSYHIGIKLPKEIKPFRLSRKLARLNEKGLEPFRYIKSIEYVEDQECQCIYLDSKDHLYLTNDFIVTHNSTIAVICLLYMLYRLLCLKDPYLFYGLQPIDKITISLMNITLDNAKGVALDKMNQMILASPWFLAHGEMAGTTNLVYKPEKHIEIVVASSNNQIIGRALFCLDGKTAIETADGIFTLEELENKYFKVKSVNNAGEIVFSEECTVKQTIKTDEEYQIELDDGTIVSCTGNHLFMLEDGTYKRADELTADDELFSV